MLCYAEADQSRECVTAARATAAYDRGLVLALHRVSHVNETRLMRPPQGVQSLLKRRLSSVVGAILKSLLCVVIYAYAYINRGAEQLWRALRHPHSERVMRCAPRSSLSTLLRSSTL